MTTIRISRKDGFIVGYAIEGHSGYAKEGQDIVCAGVSVLAQATILGLESLGVAVAAKCRDGYLSADIEVPEGQERYLQAKAVLDTMVLGFADLQKGYRAFIKLEEKEYVY